MGDLGNLSSSIWNLLLQGLEVVLQVLNVIKVSVLESAKITFSECSEVLLCAGLLGLSE